MKFSEARKRFQTQLRADARSPHTIGSYMRALRRLGPWLSTDGLGDDADLADVTPDHLARFILSDGVALKADGGARSVIATNAIKSAIRSFFRFLAETGELNANPARALRCKATGRRTPQVLAEDEQATLLATMRRGESDAAVRDHVVFSVFLATGIRIAGLVGLDVGDVDLEARRMTITGKGGRRETVILNSKLRELLRGHIGGLDGDGALFRSNRGRRISIRQVQYRLDHWLGAAGIGKRITVHSLRHTFGTKLYAHTRDLRLVQRALHHRSVTTTELYAHLADDRLAVAMEGVG